MPKTSKWSEYDIATLAFLFNGSILLDLLNGGSNSFGLQTVFFVFVVTLSVVLGFRTLSGFWAILMGLVNITWLIILL